jgi:hypothetical protein
LVGHEMIVAGAGYRSGDFSPHEIVAWAKPNPPQMA